MFHHFSHDRLHKLKVLKKKTETILSKSYAQSLPYIYRSLISESIILELPSKMLFISRQIALSHMPNVLTNGLACFVAGKISAGMDPTSSPKSYT